jgi:hypothetical protein
MMPLFSGLSEPFSSLTRVPGDAPAVPVHYAETVLGLRIIPFSSPVIPFSSFRIVSWYTKSLLVHDGKVVLSAGKALLGGLPVPDHCFI